MPNEVRSTSLAWLGALLGVRGPGEARRAEHLLNRFGIDPERFAAVVAGEPGELAPPQPIAETLLSRLPEPRLDPARTDLALSARRADPAEPADLADLERRIWDVVRLELHQIEPVPLAPPPRPVKERPARRAR